MNLISNHFSATFWLHLLSDSHHSSVFARWNASRVRQVPRGESQSCRDGPQPTITTQWRTRRCAGNPKPQEAWQAGGHFARHVEPLAFPRQIPSLKADQPSISSSRITQGQTDLTLKHTPPPCRFITTLFSFTLQARELFTFSVHFSQERKKPKQKFWYCRQTMDLTHVTTGVRDCEAACFYLLLLLLLHMWRISLRLLWTAELHVAANPKRISCRVL